MNEAKTVTATFTDISAPTVSLTAPAAGSTVSGTNVMFSAEASDNVGVAGVQFKLDGANLGMEDTTAPYAVAWDTTTATNGAHVLTAMARDSAGNIGGSVALAVSVSNSTEYSFVIPAGGSNGTTVTAGGTATFNLNLTPTSGFTGVISFSCSGAPQASTCTVNPNPASVSGTATTPIAISITTTVRSSSNTVVMGSARRPHPALPYGGGAAAALLMAGLVAAPGRKTGRRRRSPLLWVGIGCALLAVLIACGGGGGSPTGTPSPPPPTTSGTPAGTYAVHVAGTSGTVTHSFDLQLTVK